MAPPPLPPLPSGGGKTKKKKLTPAQAAANTTARAQAKANLQSKTGVPSTPGNPYVTINKKGDLVPVSNSKQALHVFGQPLKMSTAVGLYRQYNDLWINYLGRGVSAREFEHFTTLGWSQYQIINNYLVNRPNFTKSPVWKNKYNDYADVWHQIYGQDSNPDPHAVKYAIVNNLNSGAFGDFLRGQPGYLGSQEYKSNFSTMASVYQNVYGLPNTQGDQIIKRATLGRWDPSQFRVWLRQQPEWRSSDEARGMFGSVADQLGLVPQSAAVTAAPAAPSGTP